MKFGWLPMLDWEAYFQEKAYGILQLVDRARKGCVEEPLRGNFPSPPFKKQQAGKEAGILLEPQRNI